MLRMKLISNTFQELFFNFNALVWGKVFFSLIDSKLRSKFVSLLTVLKWSDTL